jgi:SOS-response transcriptional repressor LexA
MKVSGEIKNYIQVAKIIGTSSQGMTEIRKERRGFTVEQIYKFIDHFKISSSLLFEEQNDGGYLMRKTKIHIHPIVVDTQNKEKVVLVDTKAAAGYLEGFADTEYIESLPTMSVPPQLSDKSLYGFQVYGNSMESNIYEGDWALASLVEDLNRIKHNYIYVVVCEDGIVIKRVSSVDKENNCVTLTSDNTAYPPYQVHLKDIKQLWYVECTLKTSFRPKNNDLENRIKLLEKQLLTP